MSNPLSGPKSHRCGVRRSLFRDDRSGSFHPMVKLQVDGRKVRGEKRRTELIEATLRIIERNGVAGVTHRTVAAEAGVPTTSTTYHFSSLDDLLIAALISCRRGMAAEVYWMIDRARSRGSRGAEDFAGRRAEAPAPRRWRTMAE